MFRTTGVGQKIVELLKRRTVNCRTSGIAPSLPLLLWIIFLRGGIYLFLFGGSYIRGSHLVGGGRVVESRGRTEDRSEEEEPQQEEEEEERLDRWLVCIRSLDCFAMAATAAPCSFSDAIFS